MGPWTLKERIAAAAAIGIVSGVIFFIIWLYAAMSGGGPWPSLFWPGGAAILMAMIALIHPGWAEILYDKMFRDRD
jgi:hypothetical protein